MNSLLKRIRISLQILAARIELHEDEGSVPEGLVIEAVNLARDLQGILSDARKPPRRSNPKGG